MKIVVPTILVLTGLASAASAGTVHINPATAVGDPFAGPEVARAALRYQSGRANPGNTGVSTSATDPFGGAASMQSIWFSFLLSNTPGQGWSLSLTPDAANGVNGTVSPKVWRQDVDSAYNSLVIRTQAAAANLARVDLSALQFSAPGQSVHGLFPDLDVSTSGTAPSFASSRAAALADFDLGRVEWTLSGRIGVTQDVRGTKPSDEIGLWFSGVNTTATLPANGEFSVVPLPTTGALGAAGLLVIAGLRRRRG